MQGKLSILRAGTVTFASPTRNCLGGVACSICFGWLTMFEVGTRYSFDIGTGCFIATVVEVEGNLVKTTQKTTRGDIIRIINTLSERFNSATHFEKSTDTATDTKA